MHRNLKVNSFLFQKLKAQQVSMPQIHTQFQDNQFQGEDTKMSRDMWFPTMWHFDK